jgi:O-antigen ligase
MKSTNEFIAASAVIIFPASVLVVDKVYGLVFLIVILLGFWQMVTYRKEVFPISKEEKMFFFSLCIVLVSVFITTLVNDTGLARADRFLALVLTIPAYYYFKKNIFNEKYIWMGLVVGAVIAGGVAVFQVFGPSHQWRATGVVHWIIFGDLALVMGVMSLAGIGWFQKQNKWVILFPVLAFIGGMVASALSLTRGGWIALPFLLLLLVWYSSKRLTLKSKVITYCLLMLMVGSIYFIPQTGVQQRMEQSMSIIERYSESKNVNDWVRHSSIGGRFEMWKAASLIFIDNPIVGVGWGNFAEKSREFVGQGLVNKSVGLVYHPHSQFFSALSKGGLFGFFAISILFFIPITIFYKSVRDKTEVMIQRQALAGLILVASFICFGLTEAILEKSRSIIFFSFYLSVFMAAIQVVEKPRKVSSEGEQ